MVILLEVNNKTSLTAKIIASLVFAIAWPVTLLGLFLLDVKDFVIYLWSKIKK
jgi:hypothetical protein